MFYALLDSSSAEDLGRMSSQYIDSGKSNVSSTHSPVFAAMTSLKSTFCKSKRSTEREQISLVNSPLPSLTAVYILSEGGRYVSNLSENILLLSDQANTPTVEIAALTNVLCIA